MVFIISCIIANCYIEYKQVKFEQIYGLTENVSIEGVITSNPEEKEYYCVYEISIIRINDTKINNINFLLYIKKKDNNIMLSYGDLIRANCEYTEPSGQRNYKGFNYKEYLKSKNIYGILKCDNVFITDREKTNCIWNLANKIRNCIIEKINILLPKENSALLIRILIGIDIGVTEEINDYFRESNLSHMLAVSGSHVAYIILGINYILYFFPIPKKIKYLITIFLILFFIIISGASASVVRACVMGVVIIFSKIIYRKSDFLNSISLSLIIILINNPYSILDIRITTIFYSYNGNCRF